MSRHQHIYLPSRDPLEAEKDSCAVNDVEPVAPSGHSEMITVRRRKNNTNSECEILSVPPSKIRASSSDQYDIFSMFGEEKSDQSQNNASETQENIDINLRVKNEIDLYINEKIVNSSDTKYNFDILSWWMKHTAEFPILSQLSKFVHAIPASSAPSERLFSAAGNTITEKRSRISPEVLHGVLFLKSNFDLMEPSISIH